MKNDWPVVNALKKVFEKQIVSVEEIKGVLKGVHLDEDVLVLKFSDDRFAVFNSRMRWDDTEIEFINERYEGVYDLKCAGIISEVIFDEQNELESSVAQKKRKEDRLKQYRELRDEFGDVE